VKKRERGKVRPGGLRSEKSREREREEVRSPEFLVQ